MASAAGVAPAASAFAGRCSDLSELRGQLALGHLASVIGLAPIRPGVKGRLREWWPCANTFAFTDYLRRANKWSPRLVSRQRLLVFSEALICLSYPGKVACQAVAGERRLVVPRGNAPRSSAYQAGALLLSYRTGK